jgi:DNA-binding response OmpR family regulator
MAGILIIDDDPTIRTMFARVLQSVGEVETASNGAEALRMLAAKKYGVILLDLHMPVVDGFILLQTLSTKAGPNHDTPIYVVTADTSEHARISALRRHALFILTKPVPLNTLSALVDATLKKAAARAALEADGSLVADGGLEGETARAKEARAAGASGHAVPRTPLPSPPGGPGATGSARRSAPPQRPVAGQAGGHSQTPGGPKKPGT